MTKVRTELAHGVFTITLADPDNRNALSRQLIAELGQAMDRADNDHAVRVVLLTNEGNTFCAGADLSERSGEPDSARSPSSADDPPGGINIFERIRLSPKPWVGRIDGHAVAGGLGLAAVCDISVAIETAKMGFSEVRIGVAPAMISVICLPKMRQGEAIEAFLRGNRFTAVEGARLGLVNYAVRPEELDAKVEEILGDVILGGPNALAASKQLVRQVPTMPFGEAMAWTAPFSANLFESDEGQEGMRAFLDKRKPSWVPGQADGS